jgi:tetratricopeptide (TPR) repeat protein
MSDSDIATRHLDDRRTRQGAGPDVPPTANEADLPATQLAQEMARLWEQGERPRAEDLLARHPGLADQPEAVLRLVCEEICLRQKASEQVSLSEYLARFPACRSRLVVFFECQQLLREPRQVFPEVGDMVADCRLLTELGRGAQGRVFLATQASLADRPVVLKFGPLTAHEHLSLARLQHTHIVPLYSVLEDPGRGLLALCMPYFGGTTLAHLLRDRRPDWTGPDLVRALDRTDDASIPGPRRGTARAFLARRSYPEAVCWIGACLADALAYAHERDLIHLDIKPSNVLLAADGTPMLLDFHLAQKPLRPDAPDAPRVLGGTPGYMSPEQEAALVAVSEGWPIPGPVDGRSDVYSLGLVLCEMLGALIHARSPLPPPDAGVSPGLRDILARCVATRPENRYPDAAALAADLRRHLNDLPLRGVPNRSLAERWRKWRRRRPNLLPRCGILALVLLALSLVGGSLADSARRARLALDESRDLLRQDRPAEALGAAERGLGLAESVPWGARVREELEAQRLLAAEARAGQQRAHLVHHLRAVAEGLRLLDGEALGSAAELRELAARGQALWEKRKFLVSGSATGPEDERLRADLLDVAVLGADLRVRLSPERKRPEAHRRALRQLDEGEALLGPALLLDLARERHARALGMEDLARAAAGRARGRKPRTAGEYHALGRSLLRAGEPREALPHLARAVEEDPGALPFHFSHAVCLHCLGRAEEAARAFGVCIALTSGKARARCYARRAMARTALGQADQALRDYDRALALDPQLAGALVHRGMLHHRQGREPQALADLRRALECGADPATAHYDLALIHRDRGDLPAALDALDEALRHDPGHDAARSLREELRRGL